MASQANELSPEERARHIQVVESLDGFVDGMLHLFKPAEDMWQPTDKLPDFSKENDFLDECRKKSSLIKGPLLDILVLDVITEEALPTYMSDLNRIEGIRDKTGVDQSAWAKAIRSWTAEENRHGTLLYSYLLTNPHVNKRALDETIHRLIRNGFSPGDDGDPYKTFVYTSFQEEATYVSHSNVGRLALKEGEGFLHAISLNVAGDEKKHAKFYKSIMGEIFKNDPDAAMIAFADMMKQSIRMPAQFLGDGKNPRRLFRDMSIVAQKIGAYTTDDYLKIFQDLSKEWNVEKRDVSSDAAKAARDYLVGFAADQRKYLEEHPVDFDKIKLMPSPWQKNNG